MITLILALSSGLAFAGSASDDAQARFDSIASGDVNAVITQYQDSATLQWLGGPLDGTYTGKEQLSTVWSKFTKAQGPMKVKVQNLVEHANPKGSTVTADVFFAGNKTVPVHYVLSYRDGKLVNEIWQVSPSLAK
jgi:hypothetical protein